MQKNILFVLLFIPGAFAGYSQDTIYRELPPFTALQVSGKITVQLYQAEKESLSILTKDFDPRQIRTTVENNTLKIDMAVTSSGIQKGLVNLYFKEIRKMDIRNNAEVITASLFKADSLMVSLKFGGSLFLDADLGYLKSNASGGGLLTAEGYAVRQDIVVSSRATISAFKLESEIIRVEASSGGKAKISVDSELDARATTGSYISYKGDPPRKNINASPGAEVVVSGE
jgi:hypothetical protein